MSDSQENSARAPTAARRLTPHGNEERYDGLSRLPADITVIVGDAEANVPALGIDIDP